MGRVEVTRVDDDTRIDFTLAVGVVIDVTQVRAVSKTRVRTLFLLLAAFPSERKRDISKTYRTHQSPSLLAPPLALHPLISL
jgi:hypothetical protein